MLHFVGEQLRRPQESVRSMLGRVVHKLFAPKTSAACDAVVDFLLSLESAYVAAAGPLPGGEFDFEPLDGEHAGPPIYIERIKVDNLPRYKEAIGRSVEEAPKLMTICRDPRLLSRIVRCLENVIADIDRVQQARR